MTARGLRAVVIALVVATAVTACGGGEGGGLSRLTQSQSQSQTDALDTAVASAGVSFRPPRGWTTKQLPTPGGLVVAEHSADVDAATVAGPRLIAAPATSEAPTGEPIDTSEEPPLNGPVTTSETTIGGKPGAVIEWTVIRNGDSMTTRFVTVALGEGRAYTFTFEAPGDVFIDVDDTFDAILATVEFDVDAVPAAK